MFLSWERVLLEVVAERVEVGPDQGDMVVQVVDAVVAEPGSSDIETVVVDTAGAGQTREALLDGDMLRSARL